MKKLFAIVLCGILLITSVRYVNATDATENGGIYSATSYDGFDLSWTNNGERDILLSAVNENGSISF